MRSLLFLVAIMTCANTMSGEKPFEFGATPGKLSKQVRPTDYSIRIVPNIDARTFDGSEVVKFESRTALREIVLNAADLEVTGAAVDDQQVPQSAINLDPKAELLRISVSTALSTGSHTLSLKFAGKINEQGRGFFYMRYQEEGTGAKKVAIGTQFEPADARRFFPCWDEPSYRAFFRLTAVVPENWVAVSNMPIESERKINVPEGSKEVRFQQTPPMSS